MNAKNASQGEPATQSNESPERPGRDTPARDAQDDYSTAHQKRDGEYDVRYFLEWLHPQTPFSERQMKQKYDYWRDNLPGADSDPAGDWTNNGGPQ